MNLRNVRLALAIILILSMVSMLFGLFFVEAPDRNKDLINFGLGAMVGYVTSVISHFFGDPDRQEGSKK